jgi:hypothetical protein
MLAPEFLRVLVPLGSLTPDGAFAAIGAGVLIEHAGFDWLITLDSVRSTAAEAGPLVALGSTLDGEQFSLDLDEVLRQHGLGWVEDPAAEELVAAPIPLSRTWQFRSAPQSLTIAGEQIATSSACYTVGAAYGLGPLDPGRGPSILALDGIVAANDPHAGEIYFTASTLPGWQGGPLFVEAVQAGGRSGTTDARVSLLAGLVLEDVRVGAQLAPEGEPSDPGSAVRLGRARAIDAAFGLLRTAAGAEMARRTQQIARR